MIWYSHFFQNFPQFIVIHTLKGFGIVNKAEIDKAEIDVFLELSCFSHDPADVGDLISGSSAFSKSSLNIWHSQFVYCWSLAWRILSITLLVCELSTTVRWFEHPLTLPFFGTGMKTDLFQSCGSCWVFQICWHIVNFKHHKFRHSKSIDKWIKKIQYIYTVKHYLVNKKNEILPLQQHGWT